MHRAGKELAPQRSANRSVAEGRESLMVFEYGERAHHVSLTQTAFS
jgi:hypothetical protein